MKQFISLPNIILASEGPYKHSIQKMVQNSPFRFYALEQERVDLSELKKDLKYWLESLQDLLDGKYLTWDFPSRLQKLQDSEQRLQEFKSRYIRGYICKARVFNSKLSPSKNNLNLELAMEETRMRVANLVKEMRDSWITASIKYAESVARSTYNTKQRRLRCRGVIDI